MPRMREVSKEWIAYTNVRKQTLAEAKDLEAVAKSVPIYSVARRTAIRLPDLVAPTQKKDPTISYQMPRKKILALAAELGSINMSNKDVGIKSFEYTYSEFVGKV
jgi:hypothetical protein